MEGEMMDAITHDGVYRVEMAHCAGKGCGSSYPRQYMVGDLCPWCAAKRLAELERKLAEAEAALVKAEHDRNLAECERNEAYEERDEIASDAYLLHKRYAPTDGEPKSTDELLAAYFAFCQHPNRWASLYAEENGDIATEWASEGEFIAGYKHASTARAALREALKERGQ